MPKSFKEASKESLNKQKIDKIYKRAALGEAKSKASTPPIGPKGALSRLSVAEAQKMLAKLPKGVASKVRKDMAKEEYIRMKSSKEIKKFKFKGNTKESLGKFKNEQKVFQGMSKKDLAKKQKEMSQSKSAMAAPKGGTASSMKRANADKFNNTMEKVIMENRRLAERRKAPQEPGRRKTSIY